MSSMDRADKNRMENLVDLAHDLLGMQREVLEAKHMADTAQRNVKSHEELCAERYATLNRKLADIPEIFKKLDRIQTLVYMGVGIWIAVPAFLGIAYGISRLIHAGA